MCKTRNNVNRPNPIIIYLILFVFLAVLLKIIGVIDFSSLELLAYLLIFSGAGLSYISFGKDKKGLLFISSTIFLVGILLFVNTRFDLEETRLLLFPSVLFITGTGFFLLYLDDSSQSIFISLSLIFLAGSVLFVIFFRTMALGGFFASIWDMLKNYWVIILIVTGLIFILRKEI